MAVDSIPWESRALWDNAVDKASWADSKDHMNPVGKELNVEQDSRVTRNRGCHSKQVAEEDMAAGSMSWIDRKPETN